MGQHQHYSLRNYKAVDGLPQSQVSIMLEDNNGYLWIGTQGGGLARFDGREFKVFTTLDGLLSNIVTYLKLDSKQNLWIIHPRGITKYDGVTFKKFQQPGAPANAKRIRRAFEMNDSIFFIVSPGNLGKLYNDSVYYWNKPMQREGMIAYCHLNPNREIMLYLNDSSFLVQTKRGNVKLSHKKIFNRLYGIFNYHGKPWVKTDSGYYSLNVVGGTFHREVLPISNPIVYYDQINDQFWTRVGSNLLKEKIQPEGVTVDTVLRDSEVTQVLVDQEGNTWFATSGAGLYKYYIQDFDRCSSENMKAVMAVFEDSGGATWIGSMTKGLWRIKKGKISAYFYEKESYRNSISCIVEAPDKSVWVGTHAGLAHYNNYTDTFTWYTREDGLSNAMITGIQFDSQGGMWIGTFGGGVNYFDGKSFRAFTTQDGLSTNTIMTLHYADRIKTLFIGTEFGLSSMVNATVQAVTIPGIENTTVLSIHPYQDSLLMIGTGGGGVVLYNPNTKFERMITTRQGLSSDFVYFVSADDQHYIWIGTEKGINRLRLDGKAEVSEILHYDFDNGLTGVETNQNAFYLGKDKKYFGLIDGLYEFNNLKRTGLTSFNLHLTNIEILYGQYDARADADSLAGFYKIPYNLRLPPDKNHITFHFNRVDKQYPKSVKFRYKLENFDKTWSQPSSNGEVTYSNLPPGEYVFRVMATSNSGSWSEERIGYAFTILTPFYKTAAFIVGVIILLVGVIMLALYIRVKQKVNKVIEVERIRMKEQDFLRKEIARDFHDEMGNQLTRIINYISLLKLNGNGHANGNGSHDLYTKVEDSAKYLYTGTRDFIWSIDPVNDELSKLFIHIRDFGEKLFDEKNISFRAYNEIRERVKLPYGFSREANLIFKEVMTNAFKYSEARNVALSLKRRDQSYFEIIFEDDGVGFHTGDVQKSNGLKNIRERADKVNAVLRIQSMKNQGTKIVLTFTLNKTLKYGLAL